jgi:hypothetical protein
MDAKLENLVASVGEGDLQRKTFLSSDHLPKPELKNERGRK